MENGPGPAPGQAEPAPVSPAPPILYNFPRAGGRGPHPTTTPDATYNDGDFICSKVLGNPLHRLFSCCQEGLVKPVLFVCPLNLA